MSSVVSAGAAGSQGVFAQKVPTGTPSAQLPRLAQAEQGQRAIEGEGESLGGASARGLLAVVAPVPRGLSAAGKEETPVETG